MLTVETEGKGVSVTLISEWATGIQCLSPGKVTRFQRPREAEEEGQTAHSTDSQPNRPHWTHGAARTAQEKVQEGLPRVPASGTGAELETQRMLPDSGGPAHPPYALGTGPAAIPGNSHPRHLKKTGHEWIAVKWGDRELRCRLN